MPSKVAITVLPTIVMVILASASAIGQVQTGAQQAPSVASRTMWDAVYSAAQAEKGQEVYQSRCSRCHGTDLNGTGTARPLFGESFLRNWGGGTIGNLFHEIRTSMPRDAPSSLGDEEYLNVVTYILKRNGLPAGPTPVSIPELEQIQIVGKGGPEDVPNFALVHVVGCLSQRPDKSWVLINSSRPLMTKDPYESKDANLKAAEAQPLGDQTFRVVDAFPRPDPGNTGHKLEAKGFLMKVPDNDGISITSLQLVSSSCDK